MHDYPAYLPRLLEPQVARALESFPVVVVTGARQTGKSTLVQRVGEDLGRVYRTLDDLEVLDRARHEPDALVRSAPYLTLDEVQRSPEVLLAVKRAVDEERRPGRFLLTGSADLLLLRRVSESLAGRAIYLTLWPLVRREQLGLGEGGLWSRLLHAEDSQWPALLAADPGAACDFRQLVKRGGYPVPAHALDDAEARSLWFAGYTQTYLERDLRDLSAVSSLVDFRRLMRAICLRLGNVVNQTELGRDVGLSQPTVGRYLGLLEVSYQLLRLPAFAVNRTKRLIKSPKLYWSDPGLALHLAGEPEPRGVHLENLVLSDLLAWRHTKVDDAEILYWRTTTGEEVDFVIEWRGQLVPIEVKSGTRPQRRDLRGLQVFRREYGDRVRSGLLLHAGEEVTWIAEGILAAPWWRVF